jgi:hypothetical protein
MDTLRMTRALLTAVTLVMAAAAAHAQSLADLAKQTEAQRRTMPAPAPTITLGSDAFRDVTLTDDVFTQYVTAQETVARMLLGHQVRAERLRQRRRGYQRGTDATPLYEGEPELVAAIIATGLTPQAVEDIAWTIERAYEEKVADPTPIRLANRAWVQRNNARVVELDKRLQYIRAGLRP